jgi:hypothetical protein
VRARWEAKPKHGASRRAIRAFYAVDPATGRIAGAVSDRNIGVRIDEFSRSGRWLYVESCFPTFRRVGVCV